MGCLLLGFRRMTIGSFNTLKPRQNGRHFADDTFKCIFLNENVWISITIWLGFVPKGPINNIPALVQIMAWRRPGDKPLSEPIMVILPTHICVTRPQWVNAHNDNKPVKKTTHLISMEQHKETTLHFSWLYVNQHDDLSVTMCHYTTHFLQVRFNSKFISLIQILIKWLLQNFAHAMTAVLSWHVQNFVAIWQPGMKLQ